MLGNAKDFFKKVRKKGEKYAQIEHEMKEEDM